MTNRLYSVSGSPLIKGTESRYYFRLVTPKGVVLPIFDSFYNLKIRNLQRMKLNRTRPLFKTQVEHHIELSIYPVI